MTRQTDQPLTELRLTASNRSARELARWVTDDDMMTLDTPYQRGHVWTPDQRIALVRSWLQGVPIPAVVVNLRDRTWGWDGDDAYSYAVIDGKQRIQTAIEWFEGHLAVPASWFPPGNVVTTEDTDDGPYVRFTGLSRPCQVGQKREFTLPMCEPKLPSVAAEAQVYLLVNGGGTPQTDDDIARAAEIAKEH